MALRRVAILCAVMLLAAVPQIAAAQDIAGEDHPTISAGAPVSALHGIWRSRGYGYVLRIDADGLALFHVAGPFCYADPRRQRDPDGLFAFHRMAADGTVAFSARPGQTRYVFDRLSALPDACNDRMPWTPPRVAALVAATFADLYPTFAERGIDWRARTGSARLLDSHASDDALFEALRVMLAGIEDAHVELRAEIAGRKRALTPGQAATLVRADAAPGGAREDAWDEAYRRGILDRVLRGRGHEAANGGVIWGRVGDIGYLNILTMERFSPGRRRAADDPTALDAALDAAIAGFSACPGKVDAGFPTRTCANARTARAVVVDISANDGGFDWLAQRIAGRFADRPRLAYTKTAVGADRVQPQPFEVMPSERARYLGPVYLLTSDVTLSAAEVFALDMRALPNVIHVGETTRGAFSDTINKPLPNGWMLVLPGEIYRDPEGVTYEARGLPPQRRFAVFPQNVPGGGHARRVLALIEEIRAERDAAAPAR